MQKLFIPSIVANGVLWLVALALQIGGWVNEVIAIILLVIAGIWTFASLGWYLRTRQDKSSFAIGKINNNPQGLISNSPKTAISELHFDQVKYWVTFNNNKPDLEISVMLSSVGVLTMESAKIEISGRSSPCEWGRPMEIFPGGEFSRTISCKNPTGLTPGKHNMRLLIFANNDWWASNWETVDCTPSSV